MSKQIEALKKALEALEEINKLSIGENAICLPAEIDTAMDAIREALAEQPANVAAVNTASERVDKTEENVHEKPAQQLEHVIDCPRCGHCCPQPAQQQEPVACVNGCQGFFKHSPQPAQRKPLTDDPLQGAVDWLLEADGEYFCTATVQRTLRIGYNRAKRLCDTAKERAAHGIKGNA